jgi:hypothetical protein
MRLRLTLVERGGKARSFHVDGTTIAELKPIIRANVAKETTIIDELSRARNRIVHDRWMIRATDGEIARLQVTVDRRLVFEHQIHSAKEIQALTFASSRAIFGFKTLRENIGTDLVNHLKAQLGEDGDKALEAFLAHLNQDSSLSETEEPEQSSQA